jgi:hypothetical protein
MRETEALRSSKSEGGNAEGLPPEAAARRSEETTRRRGVAVGEHEEQAL